MKCNIVLDNINAYQGVLLGSELMKKLDISNDIFSTVYFKVQKRNYNVTLQKNQSTCKLPKEN